MRSQTKDLTCKPTQFKEMCRFSLVCGACFL